MYLKKYLKYKKKYLNLRYKNGGAHFGLKDEDFEELEAESEKENREREDKINGPSEFDYYEIPLSNRESKKILMFGETHLKYNKCVLEKNCIEMTDFLERITNSNNCIDFFLEQNPKKEEGWNPTNFKGGSHQLIFELRDYALELQKKANVRVQKWDLRNIVNDDGSTGFIMHDIFTLKLLEGQRDFLENYKFTNEEILDFRLQAEEKAGDETSKKKKEIKWNLKSEDEFNEEKWDNIDGKRYFNHINYNLIENNYKDNIKKLLNYLMSEIFKHKYNQKPNNDIMSMINMLCLFKSHMDSTNYIPFIKKLYIIIKKLGDDKKYKLFLKIQKNILVDMKKSTTIKDYSDKIKEYQRQSKEFNDKHKDEHILVMWPQERYRTNYNLKKEIKDILKKHFNIEMDNLLIDEELKDMFIKYFYEISISSYDYDRLIKGIDNEISFYKELEFFKKKLEKSYQKFLKFCSNNPDLFGTGEDIKQEIINIMLNEENFDERFNTNMFEVIGLNATLTDLYTFFRLFTIFDDDKDRFPIICKDTSTPKHIILYAGMAHTQFYKSILSYYNILPIKSDKNDKYVNVGDVKNLIDTFLS